MSMKLDLSVLGVPTEADEDSRLLEFDSEIAGEIERLRGLRRIAWTIRNRRLPICRLPPEILLKIFLLLRSMSFESKYDTSYRRSLLLQWGNLRWDSEDYQHKRDGLGESWENVAKVCKYWRELALGFAPLWNTLFYTQDVEKERVFLERSMQSDIEVFCRIGQSASSESTKTLGRLTLKDMARLRKLNIAFPSSFESHFAEDMGGCFSDPMPKLKEIRLSGKFDNTITILLNDWVPGSQLDVVDLHDYWGTTLAWNHPMFNNLQELFLSNILGGPSVTELLNILENCRTRIRRLGINSVDFEWSEEDSQIGSRVVHLPNLRIFDYSGDFAFLERLRLEVDSDTKFCFTIPEYSLTSTLSVMIQDTLDRFISDSQGMLNLLIFDDHVRIEFIQDVSVHKDKKWRASGIPWFILAIRCNCGKDGLDIAFSKKFKTENPNNPIMALLRQKQFRNAPKINLHVFMRWHEIGWHRLPNKAPKNLWIEIFEAIPYLARIELIYGEDFYEAELESLNSFVSALIEWELAQNGSQMCSNLEEITLTSVHLSVIQVPEVLWKLQDYLKSRTDNGKKMRKLRLASHGIPKEVKEIAASKFAGVVKELSFEPFPSPQNIDWPFR